MWAKVAATSLLNFYSFICPHCNTMARAPAKNWVSKTVPLTATETVKLRSHPHVSAGFFEGLMGHKRVAVCIVVVPDCPSMAASPINDHKERFTPPNSGGPCVHAGCAPCFLILLMFFSLGQLQGQKKRVAPPTSTNGTNVRRALAGNYSKFHTMNWQFQLPDQNEQRGYNKQAQVTTGRSGRHADNFITIRH